MSVMATESYCVDCDAPPGGCDHNTHRWLPPIKYELIEGTDPMTFRWRIPDHERERIENGHGYPKRNHAPAATDPRDEAVPRCGYCHEDLNGWAVSKGFEFCSKDCREADRA